MAVYAIAVLRIHDRERYDRYARAFMPVLQQYGGRVLAADDAPEVLEGELAVDRVVMLRFDDREALDTWARSPEYTEIARDRLAATDSVVLAVTGL